MDKRRLLQATVTVTLVLKFREPEDGKWQEAAVKALHMVLAGDRIAEVVEPHVDAIEVVR